MEVHNTHALVRDSYNPRLGCYLCDALWNFTDVP